MILKRITNWCFLNLCIYLKRKDKLPKEKNYCLSFVAKSTEAGAVIKNNCPP